jgi:signal transduction histidine kinase
MNILLVDDTPSARDPMELQLKVLGHTVTTAADGLEALSFLNGLAFELVMTDIQMPNMDGLELLRRSRQLVPGQDVIMVTGYGDMDSALEALRLGARDYLLKPVSLEELSAAVSQVVERHRMARRLQEQERRLRQAEKMAELGVVAAGVAHEINNPNTFIRGNVQLIAKFWDVIDPFLRAALEWGVPAPDRLGFVRAEMPRTLEGILAGSERIRRIVENTAAFTSNQTQPPLTGVDLSACFQCALERLSERCGPVQILCRTQENLPLAQATLEGLSEVVEELIRNSLTAVEGVDHPRIEIRASKSGPNEVLIEVEDNGRGIREEDHSKVFTPFFSTAPRIGRPGLGLSKVYALVHGFGGETGFSSRVGQGTRFFVKLLEANERPSVCAF